MFTSHCDSNEDICGLSILRDLGTKGSISRNLRLFFSPVMAVWKPNRIDCDLGLVDNVTKGLAKRIFLASPRVHEGPLDLYQQAVRT